MDRRIIRALVAGILFLVPSASAQNLNDINAGIQFDFSLPGARSLAMGGAFVALADDATAAYSNPAGLVVLNRPEFSLEGRGWGFQNFTADVGHVFGAPSNIGVDTVAGLIDRGFDTDAAGLSFLSFVYPSERWSLGVFRHELSRFNSGAGDEAATGKRRSIDVYLNSPVRYFLTAGAADQRVPDESLFRKAFVDGLRGRIPNDDDILSAEELALFVEDQVTAQNGWTQVPMYGRLLLAPRVSQGGRILFRVPLWTAALQGGRKVGDRGTSSLELMTALPTQSIADASMSR